MSILIFYKFNSFRQQSKSMKIKNLNFKQITSVINSGQLKLNLFDATDQLFAKEHRKTYRTIRNVDRFNLVNNYSGIPSRPQTGKLDRKTKFTRLPSRRTTKTSLTQDQDCYHFLQKCLVSYTHYISTEERKSIKKQLQLLLALLQRQSTQDIIEQLVSIEPTLGKKFKNRLVHLVFYLILNSLLALGPSRAILNEIKNYILCEYYSRKFNFKQLAMAICIRIQEMYCMINSYEESRVYARKSLKLAVVLNNQYLETKMIESLHILNYYEGRLTECESKLLSKQERKRILQNYNEENQTPNLFNQTRAPVQDQYDYKQFNLQKQNNFVENSVPNQNIKYFQSNYHEIVKGIPGKNIDVRNIIKRVASVGLVRKYFGRDNYITVKPQCYVIKPMYQEQVLVSHKKETNIQEKEDNLFRQLNRIRGLLEQIVQAYACRI